jgi:hypothetical protein
VGLFGDRDDEQPATAADPLDAIDRAAVPRHLLSVVDRAVASAHQMRNLAWSRAEGPVQARLFGVARRVDAVVVSVYETALRAAHLDSVAATLDPEGVTARYKEVKRRPDADPELVASLRARFESVQRILNARDSIDGDLQLLEARLEAAVARGAELLLDPTGEVDTHDAELTAVDDELTSLRAALDEVAALQPSPPRPGG